MKDKELLDKIKKHIQEKKYIVLKHALERQLERRIDLPEILYVLTWGYHEKNKDSYNIKKQSWKYAIRGMTAQGVALRIIIAFENQMAIITVMKVK